MATTFDSLALATVMDVTFTPYVWNADDHIWKLPATSVVNQDYFVSESLNFKYNLWKDQQKTAKAGLHAKIMKYGKTMRLGRNGIILHFRFRKNYLEQKLELLDDSLLINDAFPGPVKVVGKNIWSWTRWRKTMDYNYNS